MTASIAQAILGSLAGLTIATVGVPADTALTAPAPESGLTAAAPLSQASLPRPEAPDGPDGVDGADGADGAAHRPAAEEPAGQSGTLDYWTPERMASAVPRGSLLGGVVDALPPLPPLSGASPETQGAPVPTSTGRRWTGGGRVVATTGRVFLRMDGGDYTCSASVVDAENRDTVLTAGHCLKDGRGSWADNWMFVPGYDNGVEPYGRYPARKLVVSPRWSRGADDSYDFGFAVLDTDRSGGHVADRTGTQRIVFSDRVADRVYSFGYPSVSPYRGRHLHYCSGPTTPDRNGTAGAGMRCEMTQGSSGGPWFADFDAGAGTGTITSVVSFKYANDPDVQYGPRLGAEANRVYDTAQAL
ncbi:trypsin-like serine peptidase [Actinorugispora endophytica]|nr:trypsin-like serine protease [Actinorugispora endophytica]